MSLGELQQLTMLAVARLGEDAYGAAIRAELEAVANRRISVPTVHVTLVRLEEKGLVTSGQRPAAGSRGGRARRVFTVTSRGWNALERSRASMASMWEGVVRP